MRHQRHSLTALITAILCHLVLIISVHSQSTPSASKEVRITTGDAELGTLFNERDALGTLILSSLDGKTEYTWNPERAAQRFMPASTFKIPHSLIALEEQAISDENEQIAWDGVDRGWKEWNRDHTLTSAYQKSCVWFFQDVARRLDKTKYAKNLHVLQYGNESVGDQVTSFWLDNELKISAREQISFLKRLYRKELPYKESNLTKLRKIMIEEQGDDYVLRAKTGWGRMKGLPDIGWWVGSVESESNVWFFALNIQIDRSEQKNWRKEIVRAALKVKGIIPSTLSPGDGSK